MKSTPLRFGGHVAVHTGLFLNADNESELASVLGHEITHVTQRHLARSLEAQQKWSGDRCRLTRGDFINHRGSSGRDGSTGNHSSHGYPIENQLYPSA